MKRLFVILMAAFFVFGCFGCSNLKVNVTPDTKTVLQKVAISTTGYLIAKNNQKYIPEFVKWHNAFNLLVDQADIQIAFRDGVAQLSTLISDDPYLQLQVRNAMTMLEINMDGPALPEEVAPYKAAVDSFMEGVIVAGMAGG